MKLSSAILSFIVLIQSFNFDIEDLNKISNFINDVGCHLNEGESFSDFIEDHYLNADLHLHEGDSHNHEEHGELPFKHQHSDNHFQLAFVFFLNEFTVKSDDFISSDKNFSYKEPSTNLAINSFYQPPKV